MWKSYFMHICGAYPVKNPHTAIGFNHYSYYYLHAIELPVKLYIIIGTVKQVKAVTTINRILCT